MKAHLSRRTFLHSTILSTCFPEWSARAGDSADAQSGEFEQLKIGAGGWITKIDIAPDGTMIAGTDTNGVFCWNGASWDQLLNHKSLASERASGKGVWAIAIAPSRTSRFYIAYYGFMYRSDNRGLTWTKLKAFRRDANFADYADAGSRRLSGQQIAVDPVNADVVYAGTTSGGLWASLDAGSSWSLIPQVPVGVSAGGFRDNPGITAIVFDHASGVTNGRTNKIYVGSYGIGVYLTKNGGGVSPTWAQISGPGLGGPTHPFHAQIDRTSTSVYGGSYYCCEHHAANDTYTGWRYLAGAWKSIGTNISHVAVHPTISGYIILFAGGNANDMRISKNGGDSSLSIQAGKGGKNISIDIPWLAWTDDRYKSLGDARFDPSGNEVCIGEGIGWWRARLTQTDSVYNWKSQSEGLEQLVPTVVCTPPGHRPSFGVADRGIFYDLNSTSFPLRHWPNNFSASGISDCKSIEYCGALSNHLAAMINTDHNDQSCYSADGGRTWILFPSVPPDSKSGRYGGNLAINAHDPMSIVWMQSNNGLVYRTLNRGKSWSLTVPPGTAKFPGGTTGWGFAGYTTPRHGLAADFVAADTFYAFYSGTDNAGTDAAIFLSSDNAASWIKVYSGLLKVNGTSIIDSKYYLKLKAAPDNEGHLYCCSGPLNGGGSTLFRCENGNTATNSTSHAQRWTIPNARMTDVHDFGFGRARHDGYPAIYLWGAFLGVYGFYRSEDKGATWTFLADYALPQRNNQVQWIINGDMNTFGIVYVGFGEGAGFARGYFP